MKRNCIFSDVIIIYPDSDVKKDTRFGYSLSCLNIATIAKRYCKVTFFDETFEQKELIEKSIYRAIKISKKPIIVIYIDSVPLHRSMNVNNARKWIFFLRKSFPNLVILACGSYCISNRGFEENSSVTIVSEPEIVFDQILFGETPLGCLTKPTILPSSYKFPLYDINSFPLVDRNIYPNYQNPSKYPNSHKNLLPSAVVCTSIGCSRSCSFCPRASWQQQKVRFKKHDDVYNEIKVLSNSGIKNIWISDEDFMLSSNHSIPILKSLKSLKLRERNVGIYLSSSVHISEDQVKYAFDAGVRVISFGIESASQRVLEYFNKNQSPIDISNAIFLTEKYGIYSVGNIIFGSPVEEDNDIQETMNLILKLPIDSLNVKILSYIKGSKIWNDALKKGLLNWNDDTAFADSRNGTSNRQLSVIKEQVNQARNLFSSNFNKNRFVCKVRKVGPPYFRR